MIRGTHPAVNRLWQRNIPKDPQRSNTHIRECLRVDNRRCRRDEIYREAHTRDRLGSETQEYVINRLGISVLCMNLLGDVMFSG